MADNLKQLIARVNEVLDGTKGPNWVKVENHNDIEQQIITKTGKNTGFPFLASANGIDGTIPAGTLSWNGNLMNNTDLFTITISDKTLDFNKIEEYIKLLASGSLIHFKDFVGRSVVLKYQSYIKTTDGSANNVLILSVNGLVDNINYAYQTNEFETCIIEFFNNMDSVLYPDAILKFGEIAISGLDIDLDYDAFNWRVDRFDYINTPLYSETLTEATSGFYRKDVLLGDNTGNYQIIEGTEGDESVSAPTVFPIGTIPLAIIDVFGNTVLGTLPPTFDGYVKTAESVDFIFDSGATTVLNQIDLSDDRSSISLTGSATDLKSIQVSAEFIRAGKPHYFKNRTGHNVTLWHLAGTGNIKYLLPNSANFVVKPNEVIEFSTNTNDLSNIKFEFVGGSVDLSNYYNKTEVDSLIVGLWDDRGSFDASVNAYPSTGGSGISGAILKGDIWTVSVPGTLPTGKEVEVGDTVRALVDSPANTQANWSILQNNIGYVAENTANKTDDIETNKTSSIIYTSAKAVYDWVVSKFQPLDNQIEINANGNVQNAWHGQTILFTANCTITVPATLNNGLMFPFRTLAGVTVTWAITAPFTWETTPGTTTEKTTGHFMRRGATNTIMLDM